VRGRLYVAAYIAARGLFLVLPTWADRLLDPALLAVMRWATAGDVRTGNMKACTVDEVVERRTAVVRGMREQKRHIRSGKPYTLTRRPDL
jgi:hypothetical protein